jgi:hypothetical protein
MDSYKPEVSNKQMSFEVPGFAYKITKIVEWDLEAGSDKKPKEKLLLEDEIILDIAERIPEARILPFITWFTDFYIKWKKEWKKEFYEWCSGLELRLANLLIERSQNTVNLFY